MGAKTYRMTVPQLKKMCDFFAIDRMNCNGKDALVDVLLDFLGEPEENMLKGGAKAKGKADSSSSSKKKSKAKKVEAADDDAGDYSDVGDDGKEEATTKEGELPSDEALRKWVRAYVRCHNMKQSTIKHALEIAGEKFGVDLSEKKQRLKELLTEEM
jgi:DEK C terminal domain